MRKLLGLGLGVLLGLLVLTAAKAQQPVELFTCFETGSPPRTNCLQGAGFLPSATGSTGTPITATTGGATGTLPTGTTVVVSNVGTTNTAYCKLGTSSTMSDQAIAPGSWFAFMTGAATQLTCKTSSSTTTVNMVGGSGLATGAGGGGGSGGSAVTQGTTPWVDNISQWGSVALGAPSAYGTSPGAVIVPGVNAFVTNSITTGTPGTPSIVDVVSFQGVAGMTPVVTTSSTLTTTMTNPVPVTPTFSALLAANASRKTCLIQNTGTTLGYLYLAASGGTTGSSFQLQPGDRYTCAPGETVGITGTCASGTCNFAVSSTQ